MMAHNLFDVTSQNLALFSEEVLRNNQGKTTHMLILVFERNADTLVKFMGEPEQKLVLKDL
jgi:hypothetical protein